MSCLNRSELININASQWTFFDVHYRVLGSSKIYSFHFSDLLNVAFYKFILFCVVVVLIFKMALYSCWPV